MTFLHSLWQWIKNWPYQPWALLEKSAEKITYEERTAKLAERQKTAYLALRKRGKGLYDNKNYVNEAANDIRPTLVRAAGKPPTRIHTRRDDTKGILPPG